MNNHELSCILCIILLIFFSIDYLSDDQITDNETKIGICIFFHHLACVISGFGSILCLFFNGTILSTTIIVLISIIIQAGFLVNNDYCWYTKMVNNLIDPQKPNRKWRGDYESLIKHYIRGDEWAYSDIRNIDQTQFVIFINIILILILIKISIHKD